MAASKASAQAEVTFDMDSPCFSSDEFRMYQFKMKRCPRARPHDWTQVEARMDASSVSRAWAALQRRCLGAPAACCHARVAGQIALLLLLLQPPALHAMSSHPTCTCCTPAPSAPSPTREKRPSEGTQSASITPALHAQSSDG